MSQSICGALIPDGVAVLSATSARSYRIRVLDEDPSRRLETARDKKMRSRPSIVSRSTLERVRMYNR
jgi:hypothetical protein